MSLYLVLLSSMMNSYCGFAVLISIKMFSEGQFWGTRTKGLGHTDLQAPSLLPDKPVILPLSLFPHL